jgi:glutathione peroxidase
MKLFLHSLLIVLVLSMTHTPSAASSSLPQSKINAYQFSFTSIDGTNMPLSGFQGQVLLVVNTASQCGFTKQYTDLQNLYERYKDQGLVVIGVPCNDFGKQEPGSLDAIKDFTTNQFGVTFPMTQKYSVKGDGAHPFFTWASRQKKGAFLQSSPKWNFHKFLINQNGELVKSFGSQINPLSENITREI